MIFCAEPHSATRFRADFGGAAFLLDQLLGLLGGRGRATLPGQRGANIGDDDLGAGCRHGQRDLAAYAAARPGHHYDLAFHHASHHVLLR